MNGHTVSSTCQYIMEICENSDVKIKNGNFFVDSTETNRGFLLCNGGKLSLKNVNVDIVDNGSSNLDIIRIYDRDPIDVQTIAGQSCGKIISHDGTIYYSYGLHGPIY